MSGIFLRRWGLGLALSLHLLGCQSNQAEVSPANSNGALPSPIASTFAPQSFTVVIEPGTPTTETDLIAVSNEVAVAYRWMRNGQIIDGAVGRKLSRNLFARNDEISVTVMLDDRNAEATTRIHNSPPRTLSVKLDPSAGVYHGVDLRAVPVGIDADGDEIRWSYQWVINRATSPSDNTSVLPGDRYRRGDIVTVQIVPSDAESTGVPYIPLPITIPNAPPMFTTTPLAAFTSDVYRYDAHAEDADGDTVYYHLIGAPVGMVIDPARGHVVWPLSGQPNGRYTAEIVAEDGTGGRASQRLEVSLGRTGGT